MQYRLQVGKMIGIFSAFPTSHFETNCCVLKTIVWNRSRIWTFKLAAAPKVSLQTSFMMVLYMVNFDAKNEVNGAF